jgi:hypothetical protein
MADLNPPFIRDADRPTDPTLLPLATEMLEAIELAVGVLFSRSQKGRALAAILKLLQREKEP